MSYDIESLYPHTGRLRFDINLTVLRSRLILPAPVAFALRVALFTFALLLIMPPHPIAIPAAFGGGSSISILFHSG